MRTVCVFGERGGGVVDGGVCVGRDAGGGEAAGGAGGVDPMDPVGVVGGGWVGVWVFGDLLGETVGWVEGIGMMDRMGGDDEMVE